MKIRYYPETDTLYIGPRDVPSLESEEIAPDIVVDYDATGGIAGFEIDRASRKVDVGNVEISGLGMVHVVSGTRPPAAPTHA